jgi:hypothetical protein
MLMLIESATASMPKPTIVEIPEPIRMNRGTEILSMRINVRIRVQRGAGDMVFPRIADGRHSIMILQEMVTVVVITIMSIRSTIHGFRFKLVGNDQDLAEKLPWSSCYSCLLTAACRWCPVSFVCFLWLLALLAWYLLVNFD